MTDQAQTSPSGAKKLFQRAIDGLATLLSIGVMLAAGLILWEDGPVSSALSLFVAGLVLLPYIPIRYGGVRALVFIVGLSLAIGLPATDSFETHKQSRAAVASAQAAAVMLAATAVKDGQWPEDLSGKLPDKLDLPSDGYSRDIRVTECYKQACAFVVTFADERYQHRLHDHGFVLRTEDGGATWHCGPGGVRPALAADLPSTCRESAAP
ncbi:MAG TPA: hypothetical protein VLG68_01740 [Gammaproteobacteria bacterium]|nr:hypothetical protein [Gammaproteobacteria bacterium]